MREIFGLAALLLYLPSFAVAQEPDRPRTAIDLEGRPVSAWIEQLSDTSRASAREVWLVLDRAGPSAQPAVPALVELLRSSEEHVRYHAAVALAMIGPSAEQAKPELTDLLDDRSERVRDGAIEALGAIGPAAADALPLIAPGLSDPSLEVRRRTVWAIGQIGGAEAVPHLARALQLPDPWARRLAVYRLARMGPEARQSVTALTPLLADTTAALAGEAAAAVGRILPRTVPHVIPMRVQIEGAESALRDDGWGAYVTDVDSVWALSCEALNLYLSPPRGPCHDPMYVAAGSPMQSIPEPRAIVFDLSRPVPGSGAESLGVLRDPGAELHVFWRHEHEERIDGIYLIPVSDSVHLSERAQLHVNIDGEPHWLQLGTWTAGEFQRDVPSIDGEGTTQVRISRPSEHEWIVDAPTGTRARLWNVADRSRPIDRGLYEFPFRIRWVAFSSR